MPSDILLREFVKKMRPDIAATLAEVDRARATGNATELQRYVKILERHEATANFVGMTRLAALINSLGAATKREPITESQWFLIRDGLVRIESILDRIANQPMADPEEASPIRELLGLPAEQEEAEQEEAGEAEPASKKPMIDLSSEPAAEPAAETGAREGIVSLPVDTIEIGSRLRRLKPAAVTMLADSVRDIGLRTPITVAVIGDAKPLLVSGLHRLEAAKSLGHKTIDCLVLDDEGLEREIWEIDENLARCELTQLERDRSLARRKEIFDARYAEREGRAASSAGGRGNKGFATETGAQLGLSKRRINASLMRSRKIASHIQDAIKDMPAARSAVELDALAELDDRGQARALRDVVEGRAANFREARDRILNRTLGYKAEQKLKKLKTAWLSADDAAREAFLVWLSAEYGIAPDGSKVADKSKAA